MQVAEMLEVYFVAGTQDTGKEELPVILEKALQAGVTCFQFREKGASSIQHRKERKEMAQICQQLCRQYSVPFIVNDDVDLALEIGADGVHVGQGDHPIEGVIERCGQYMLIGYSTNNWKQYVEANEIKGIDYAGVGPVFTTQSKEDAQPVVGLDLLKRISESPYSLPVVAIGGINEKNVQQVWQTGSQGISVISAVAKSTDIQQTVDNLKKTS